MHKHTHACKSYTHVCMQITYTHICNLHAPNALTCTPHTSHIHTHTHTHTHTDTHTHTHTHSPGVAVVISNNKDGQYGTQYKIVPETTQNFTNRITCFRIPGMKEGPVMPQGVLPDTTNFTVSTGGVGLQHDVWYLCPV